MVRCENVVGSSRHRENLPNGNVQAFQTFAKAKALSDFFFV